jgi:hypothetical protein
MIDGHKTDLKLLKVKFFENNNKESKSLKKMILLIMKK